MLKMQDAGSGCSNSFKTRALRVLVLAAAFAASVGSVRPVLAEVDEDVPQPRVGEIPTGCNTNAFNAQISVLGGTCVGSQLTYAITLTNPLNPNDPPFKNCQASNVVVRFWAPGNLPNNFPDICGSNNETINLTTVVNGGPITLLPPATQSYLGGPGLPQLQFTPVSPGTVTAYVCITGISNTSTVGTPIVNARAVDTEIAGLPPCDITGAGSVCAGQTTQWCAPEGENLTYLWEGTGVAGQTTRCVSVGTAGEKCVTVTNTLTGCSQRCCKTLVVNPLPDCTITGGNVCTGQTTQWCAPEGANLTYLWEGTGVAGQTTRCVTVGTAGEYCVTVTNTETGCGQRCCKTLVVNPLPDCTITGGNVCTGQTTQWCAPEGANLTYLWEGTGVAGQTTRCVTVGTAGEYCVTVTNTETGCSQRCCKTLVVNPLPDCTITGGNVCTGQTTQWCAPEGANLTYLWEGTGVAGQTTRCVTVGTAGEYCVTVTNTVTGCSQRCCKTLVVNPLPDCTITGTTTLCTGQTTQWCAPEGANLTYLWEGTGVAGQTTRCVTVGTAGEYCVTVTNTVTGCSKRCCQTLVINPCASKACSPGYWKQTQHFPAWCQAGYNPTNDHCFNGPDNPAPCQSTGSATLFVTAFQITDFTAQPNFNKCTTLFQAVSGNPGGTFNQVLFQGTASLLNAAAFPADFGHTVADAQLVMQQAFAGTITFAQAKNIFAGWIAQEAIGGCPCNNNGCQVNPPAAGSNVNPAGTSTEDQAPAGDQPVEQTPIVKSSGACGAVGAASMVPFMLVGLSFLRRRKVHGR